jgi:F0F1-type ATP synthase membrane subunit c/vacuolar-type H+-ATPase subunit K
MELEAVKLLAGAIALLPLMGIGPALGMIFSSYNEAISRNPGAADLLNKRFMFTFAVTEALAIFALLIAFYLVFA